MVVEMPGLEPGSDRDRKRFWPSNFPFIPEAEAERFERPQLVSYLCLARRSVTVPARFLSVPLY